MVGWLREWRRAGARCPAMVREWSPGRTLRGGAARRSDERPGSPHPGQWRTLRGGVSRRQGERFRAVDLGRRQFQRTLDERMFQRRHQTGMDRDGRVRLPLTAVIPRVMHVSRRQPSCRRQGLRDHGTGRGRASGTFTHSDLRHYPVVFDVSSGRTAAARLCSVTSVWSALNMARTMPDWSMTKVTGIASGAPKPLTLASRSMAAG